MQCARPEDTTRPWPCLDLSPPPPPPLFDRDWTEGVGGAHKLWRCLSFVRRCTISPEKMKKRCDSQNPGCRSWRVACCHPPPPPLPKWQLMIIRIIVNVKVIFLTYKQVIFLLWLHDLRHWMRVAMTSQWQESLKYPKSIFLRENVRFKGIDYICFGADSKWRLKWVKKNHVVYVNGPFDKISSAVIRTVVSAIFA